MEFLVKDSLKQPLTDAGLLVMRLWAGLIMFYAHGWGKLMSFGDQVGIRDGFLGMPGELAAGLLVFAEVFCAILLALGLATRAVAVPLFITMMIAAFIGHGGDPFRDKELALFFGTAYFMFMLTGPGKYSLDHVIEKKWKRRA
jgi:putative oxidoreductase